MGSSAHKFYGVLGSRGGVAKMFEHIFGKMISTASKKTKMKNTKKMQRSSHKWVLGEILQKLKGCLGKKFARVRLMCMCVCVMGYTCHEKKVKKKYCTCHRKKKHSSTAPSHLAS